MTGITFTPLVPAALILLLLALAIGLVGYGLWRGARGVLLRALPILALIIAIADPELMRENRSALKDVAVVIVDESASQQLGARTQRTSDALKRLRNNLNNAENLEVRVVHAGRSETRGQNGTRLFGALTAAMSDVPSQRLAGAILITDGQVHDALTPEQATQIQAPYLKAPLHVLITGEKEEYDRRVRVDRAPDFGLVDEPAMVMLKVEDTAVPNGTPVTVTIGRNGGAPRALTLPAGEPTEVPLPIENAGANVFEVEIAAGIGELSGTNNRTLITINGVRDRLRVLLVSGQPHVGERAWRNLLKSDPNVDLIHFTILRPLNKDDGTPLNELALITFPIRELFEEKLSDFDLVIFDRYSQRGLVPFQFMANVADYVRAGGAVMLAVGTEYSDSFSLFGSPLQSILPAEPTGRVFSGAFRPRLSTVGRRHPVTAELEGALASDAEGGEPKWGRWLRQIQIRPSESEPIMTGREDEPLLILDRVGEGRVALLLSDTVWLWGAGFDGGGPQVELLRRVAHWLMKEPELEEEHLSAEMRDGALVITRRSLAEEELPVTITSPSGQEQTVIPKDTGKGKFTAQISIDTPGLYQLTDGTNTTVAAVGAPNLLETYDVVATADRVTPLVRATNGGVYWLESGTAPAVRRAAPGRIAHGSSWLGLRANQQFVVTGVTQTPLAPVALILLLVMAGALLAWWQEGK
jgi:hypothetical protein